MLIFLDIMLPASKDYNLLSGEDLGFQIKRLLPEHKIIVSTSYSDKYRIHSIFQNLNPEAILIKNDITNNELVDAIKAVLSNLTYYSTTVVDLLKIKLSKDFLLDETDRKLLFEISIGTKTKNLPKVIPLSITSIETRKRRLREIFDVTEKDDELLISIAREKGFI